MYAFLAVFLIFAVLMVVGVVFFQIKKTEQDRLKEEEKPDVEYVCTRCDDLDCDCSKRKSEES